MSVGAKRSVYFDHVKLALILLVVLGHTLSPLKDSHNVLTMWKWIYTFHMPLFVFINGYFSSLKKDPLEKCTHFFLLYVGMQLLSTCCMLIFRFDTLSFSLWKPRFGLWYLVGLILWTWMLPLTRRISPAVLLSGSVALSLAAGYCSFVDPVLALSRVLFFFPFFLLGFYAKKLDPAKVSRFFRHPAWKLAAAGVLFLLALLLFRYGNRLPQGLFLAKTAYSRRLLALAGPAWLYRLGFYGAACLSGGAFLLLIPRRACPLSSLGQRTLAVYMGHLLVLDLFKDEIPLLARILPVPAIAALALMMAFIFCHPVFMQPLDWLMRLPLLSSRPNSFLSLRPAPPIKRLRHWRILPRAQRMLRIR